ncbi:MAG: hypothetical protein Q9196_004273 [Gyalolechia fulgens]
MAQAEPPSAFKRRSFVRNDITYKPLASSATKKPDREWWHSLLNRLPEDPPEYARPDKLDHEGKGKEVVRPREHDCSHTHDDKFKNEGKQKPRRRVNWADETTKSKKDLAKAVDDIDERRT